MAAAGGPGDDADEATPGAVAAFTRDVFVSYAAPDVELAQSACARLEAEGISCWIAPRDVAPGMLYAESIVNGINASRILLLVLSRAALNSPHVGKEVERASSKRHPLLALKIDDAPLPPAFEYFLSESHWVDARESMLSGVWPVLARAVRDLLAAKAAVTPATAAVPMPGIRHGAAAPLPSAARAVGLWPAALALLALLAATAFYLTRGRNPALPVTPGVATAPAVAPPPAGPVSIAVLPFTDMSEKKDQEYFSDGLTDELIDKLAQNPELKVPARTSSFYFKGRQATVAEIAKTLGVNHVLEGSVRRSDTKMRVTAELIQADNGFHVWSHSYDRPVADVFAMQDDIAGAVVEALDVKLLKPMTATVRPTQSTAAYDAYLGGRDLLKRFDSNDYPRAVAALREATRLDPAFADAWATLAEAQFWLADEATEAAVQERSREEAFASVEKAIALAPTHAEGYRVRGLLRAALKIDPSGAAADFDRALALAPQDPDVQRSRALFGLMPQGRVAEARAALAQVAVVDPLNAKTLIFLGWLDLWSGNQAAARASFTRAGELSPGTATPAWIGLSYALEGKPAQALKPCLASPVHGYKGLCLVMAYHDLGQLPEAEAARAELIRANHQNDAYQIAESYAWTGDPDQAFKWLQTAYEQQDSGVLFLKVDTIMQRLAGDPRYAQWLRKLKVAGG